MWKETSVFLDDMERLCQAAYIPWESLGGKTVLVTGATGLIGSTVVSGLLYAGEKKKLDLAVIALVRDEEKAREKFAGQLEDGMPLQFAVGTVEHLPQIEQPIDYIIHGASPTASAWFVEHPVETVKTAVNGTINMLELAKQHGVGGFVYLSSMEIYGTPEKGKALTESDLGYLDPLQVRSCYPEGKRMSESLCACYASEYGVAAMSVRLAQTFGPGVAVSDRRVFAEFARCAMKGQDIVLHTAGKSEHCYLYTMDAVAAILTVLLRGQPGAAYNAANPDTYCSIADMARLVAGSVGLKSSEICFNISNSGKYSPEHYLLLDTCALKRLGWIAEVSLAGMFQRMIQGPEWTRPEFME